MTANSFRTCVTATVLIGLVFAPALAVPVAKANHPSPDLPGSDGDAERAAETAWHGFRQGYPLFSVEAGEYTKVEVDVDDVELVAVEVENLTAQSRFAVIAVEDLIHRLDVGPVDTCTAGVSYPGHENGVPPVCAQEYTPCGAKRGYVTCMLEEVSDDGYPPEFDDDRSHVPYGVYNDVAIAYDGEAEVGSAVFGPLAVPEGRYVVVENPLDTRAGNLPPACLPPAFCAARPLADSVACEVDWTTSGESSSLDPVGDVGDPCEAGERSVGEAIWDCIGEASGEGVHDPGDPGSVEESCWTELCDNQVIAACVELVGCAGSGVAAPATDGERECVSVSTEDPASPDQARTGGQPGAESGPEADDGGSDDGCQGNDDYHWPRIVVNDDWTDRLGPRTTGRVDGDWQEWMDDSRSTIFREVRHYDLEVVHYHEEDGECVTDVVERDEAIAEMSFQLDGPTTLLDEPDSTAHDWTATATAATIHDDDWCGWYCGSADTVVQVREPRVYISETSRANTAHFSPGVNVGEIYSSDGSGNRYENAIESGLGMAACALSSFVPKIGWFVMAGCITRKGYDHAKKFRAFGEDQSSAWEKTSPYHAPHDWAASQHCEDACIRFHTDTDGEEQRASGFVVRNDVDAATRTTFPVGVAAGFKALKVENYELDSCDCEEGGGADGKLDMVFFMGGPDIRSQVDVTIDPHGG